MDNIGSFYILDGTVRPACELMEIDTQKYKVVYEVIRIIEGIPLFLEDHYERMANSFSLMGLDLKITVQELKRQICMLSDANQMLNCNVKVVVYHDLDVENYMIYISKSYYPGKKEIDNGVSVNLINWERENPNIKLVNNIYKDMFNRKIKENNVFEILLVNNKNQITEGSKSNVFFIKGSKVYTAPGEYVLKGITRKYVINACNRTGVEVVENFINVNALDEIEALFLSGTSIKVLPVSEVDGRRYSSSTNPVLIAIRDEFDRMIYEYISGHRK